MNGHIDTRIEELTARLRVGGKMLLEQATD